MVLDYSSQRPVSKNRPRKRPAAFFIVAMLVTAGIAFLLGLGTGWFMFGGSRKSGEASVPPSQRKAEVAAQNQAQPAAGPAAKPVEPSLTFYETLPKGGRELIGSGLNMPKKADQATGKAAPRPAPPLAAKAPPQEQASAQPKESKAPAKEPEKATAKESAVKEGEGKGKFIVQVASYRTRKDAEEARDRLKADGLAAYVVESDIPEKGIYYRVRVGRHLDQQAAHEAAEKAGKGSILIPE
ncbi:MAG TPA: SPOR domain-containing protein [Geobacteraceae bacterium]|nr:SPOR domain-containing protein [Geobacteraceae bacterium]